MNKLTIKLFALSMLFFTSCTTDDDLTTGNYKNGILISGEGSGAGTGSITYVSNDFTTTESLIYKKENNSELGTFLQSIAFNNRHAFIVVDNANSITVVDRYTFKEETRITEGLIMPRFMVAVGDKGYVTNWGAGVDETDDFIAVIDLNTFSVEETIPVANGPERILAKNGKIYVSHKGAFSTNNIISVIDLVDNSIEEITVKDNPDELFFNSSGDLVVLSEGRTLYDDNWNIIGNTLASISTINTNTLSITSELIFSDGEHPSLMVLDENTIYYALNGEIYELGETSITLPMTSILTTEGYLYGMEVKNNSLYTLDANFSDLSTLHVYDLTTKAKTQTKSVALAASKIYFN